MSTDAAYAAGLIDADGYIGIASRQRGNGPRYYQSRLTLGMTHPALPALQHFQATWGGSLAMTRPATDRWAEAWAWTMQGGELPSMLRLLMPYLRIKLEQAQLVVQVEEWKAALPRRANGTPVWNPEIEEVCAEAKARIHVLNAKGPRARSAEH